MTRASVSTRKRKREIQGDSRTEYMLYIPLQTAARARRLSSAGYEAIGTFVNESLPENKDVSPA